MPEYKYYCPNRPSVNRLPKDGLQYVEAWKNQRYFHCIGAYMWGYAVYNRQLTPEEIADCGLITEPKED